ncbi:cysteine proteinase [Salix suchowensis]|nr:cysteine proteinase [Salix suchowensis]
MRLLEDLKRQRSSDGSRVPRRDGRYLPLNPYQASSGKFQMKKINHKSSAEAVGPRRRSARQILIADDALRQPRQPRLDPDEIIPANTTGAVTIKNSDLERLRPGEFLNDTLIEFGLKYVMVITSPSVTHFRRLWLKDLEESHPELAKDATDAPVNNVALSKIPQTPEEDLAELTNEMLISPRDRSKTPSDVQEVVDQLEPESEDELIGGGPTDSPLTDMEALESVHARAEGLGH